MSEPYDGVILSNCVECGKAVDLVEARTYQSPAPRNIDDPVECEDCYYKAECAGCKKVVPLSDQRWCACAKYGMASHEELVWCGDACRDKAHDGPEPEPEEQLA